MEKKKREREKEREKQNWVITTDNKSKDVFMELPHLFEMEKSLSLKSHFFFLIPFIFSLLKKQLSLTEIIHSTLVKCTHYK